LLFEVVDFIAFNLAQHIIYLPMKVVMYFLQIHVFELGFFIFSHNKFRRHCNHDVQYVLGLAGELQYNKRPMGPVSLLFSPSKLLKVFAIPETLF